MSATNLTKKGQDTRERILSSARALLVGEGIEHLVLRDVAASCAMKLGNLQYYFPSREDLLYAIIQREARGDITAMEVVLASGDDPHAMLEKIIGSLLSRWLEGDGAAVYATLNLYQLHRQKFRDLYREIYADHHATFDNVIRMIKPELSPSERRLRVQLITALIDGALLQVASGSGPRFQKRVTEQALAIALS